MPLKFQGSDESRLDGFEKDRSFLNIPQWLHMLGKTSKESWFLYFVNNDVKTFSGGLKILENIEIKHVFQSKTFFDLIFKKKIL